MKDLDNYTMFPGHHVPPQRHSLFALFLISMGVILPLLSAFSAPHSTLVGASALPTARVIAPTPVRRPPTTDHRPPTTDHGPGEGERGRGGEGENGQSPVSNLQSPISNLQSPWQATATITPVPLPAVGVAGAAPDQALPPVATLAPTHSAERPNVPDGPAAPAALTPILMYHYIRAVDQASDPLGYELSIEPALFEQQIAWLHGQGYAGIRMDALARCLRGEAPCPPRAVALTFDDGYADAFTDALPVLRRYGYSATFYIVSGLVGQPGYMTWDQLAALRDAGMEIGAHSIDHPDLTMLDVYEAERQVAQSKADLERGLGIEVLSFCYPAGLYSTALEEQVRAAGFLSATTTRWDADYSDVMALPRRRISGGTAAESFAWIMQ